MNLAEADWCSSPMRPTQHRLALIMSYVVECNLGGPERHTHMRVCVCVPDGVNPGLCLAAGSLPT